MSLAGYLLNSLWQFPAIMLATWILVRVWARRHALFRYRLWLAGLILSVILPACPRPILQRPAPTSMQSATEVPLTMRPLNVMAARRTSQAVLLEFILVAYCGVVAFGCLRLLLGLGGTFGLVKKSSPIAPPPASATRYEAAANRLGLKAVPALRVQIHISSPATAGWNKPCILLPANFSSWSEDDLWAAISHELMHIVRKDFVWNIVCHTLLLPLLYNPLSWWLRRQIEVAREMVCDEMAANLLADRQGYAQALLSVSRASFHSRHSFALNWYTKHPLEERMMQLMASTGGKQPNRLSLPLSIATLGGFALMLTLGSSLVAHAQSQAPSAAATHTPVAEGTKNTQQSLAIAKGTHAHVMKRRGTFEHPWKAVDGQNIVILTQSAEPPSAEERQRVEKIIGDNKATLDSLTVLLDGTGQKLSTLNFKDMEEQIHKAELALNDPVFQKTMADFQQKMNDGSLQRKMQEAEKALKSLENK